MRTAMPYPCNGPRASRVLSTIRSSVPCNTSPRVCAIAILLLTINRRLYLLLLIVNRSSARYRREPERIISKPAGFLLQRRPHDSRAAQSPNEESLTRLVDLGAPGDLP